MSCEDDLRQTLANRDALEANGNLLHWYRSLFDVQLGDARDLERKRVLEIGSGMSPIKRFHPSVMTSDVLRLDYLDHVFDCHAIDTFDGIPDRSLDMMIMTNVLHHLKAPVEFLLKARAKMKPGGTVVIVEPYFSTVSASRRSPSRATPIWPRMSPMIRSGVRLFARRIPSRSVCISPRDTRRTGGNWMPS